LDAAEKASGIALKDPKTKADMKKMENDLEDAFNGTMAQQGVKRNRFAKSFQFEALEQQRK